MSQFPVSFPSLTGMIAPNPNPPLTSSTTSTTNARLVTNGNHLPRSKLQNVPAFLNKLYNMVDDSSTDSLISWSDDGLSFIVTRHEEFAKKVLPRFFKHSNFSSFVRQLNMYGFHKVPHVQNGSLNSGNSASESGNGEAERWEFSNPHFQRNQPDLLLLVTRKKGRESDEKETGTVDLHHILDEIAAIKKHQASISSELKNVQNDTQLLWQENIAAKERHHKHQETIDKILRFLASVFSGDKKKPGVTPRKRQFLLGDAVSNDIIPAAPEGATSETSRPASKNATNKRRYSKIEEVEDEEVSEPIRKGARKLTDSINLSDNANISSTNNEWPFLHLNSVPTSSTPATDDLAAAIALNNQTKKDSAASLTTLPSKLTSGVAWTMLNPTLTTAPTQLDLSTLVSLPQFQGLVNLAQTNPALFNQLTNTNYFDVPTSSSTSAIASDFTKITTAAAPTMSSSPPPTLSDPATSVSTPVNADTPLATPTTAEDLELSLKSLATELGFEALNSPINSSGLDVDIDEFINTYSKYFETGE
ncbi:hypothetical protein BDF20DRAFT_876887 [Mycotypha africana]|uniref:uncharacterized protein n=1 Tax=Mycotypha africana TaxID=64632 RepID=UPI0023006B2F|nr:uncharacterized protein BDF20DRAFT_876887 [Mycotypha africana]KAI8975105.1 hypothetical protein BDF20DRAFT_876887 [Mycotypha africana]